MTSLRASLRDVRNGYVDPQPSTPFLAIGICQMSNTDLGPTPI